jgi:hypothetical protein
MYRFLFLFFSYSIYCQTNPENWVCRDAIGYDYYLENNTLYKKNEKELLEFKNLSLGKLSGIDVKNPFQVVAIYKDFNTIILLDNFLNEIKKIDFFNLFNGLMVEYIATAAGNKLWIKEKNNNLFYLFDVKTLQLHILSSPILDKITMIDSDFNSIYFLDIQNKLFQMNVFGNTQLLFEFDKKIETFKINKNNLFYVVDYKLFQKNLEKKIEILIYESGNKIENFCIIDNKIIIFANENFVEIALN